WMSRRESRSHTSIAEIEDPEAGRSRVRFELAHRQTFTVRGQCGREGRMEATPDNTNPPERMTGPIEPSELGGGRCAISEDAGPRHGKHAARRRRIESDVIRFGYRQRCAAQFQTRELERLCDKPTVA